MWPSDGVQILVNVLRDALDLGRQLVFDLEQVVLVSFGDEVDGDTQMSEPSRSTDSVEVGLSILWEVEVYHHVHGLDGPEEALVRLLGASIA